MLRIIINVLMIEEITEGTRGLFKIVATLFGFGFN